MSNNQIVDRLKNFVLRPRVDLWMWSSLKLGDGENIFRFMLSKCNFIHNALEIGTFLGMSSALIAEYADMVHTLDMHYYDNEFRNVLWEYLGVNKKIVFHPFSANKQKMKIIKDNGPYDFVFIDGSHLAEAVALDFSLVYDVPKILMHDYGLDWADITEFVDKVATDGYNGNKYDLCVKVPFALLTRRMNDGN